MPSVRVSISDSGLPSDLKEVARALAVELRYLVQHSRTGLDVRTEVVARSEAKAQEFRLILDALRAAYDCGAEANY